MLVPSAKSGRSLGILFFAASLLAATVAGAQGVSVAPNRILLDGKTRSATVFLSNRSDKAETYRISLAYYSMEEDGALVRADSTAALQDDFAGHVLRYSPRRVVIPAGGSQTVRLLVRRPRDRDVAGQEFRAHLSVCSVPMVPRLMEMEEVIPEVEGDDKIVVRPVASVETLVPMIVRFDRLEATMKIADARILDGGSGGGQQVAFKLMRTGDRSLYGNLTVTHVDPDGAETQLFFGRGVAVYTPLAFRRFVIDPPREDFDLLSGVVRVDFHETADGGGDLRDRVEIHPAQLSRR